MAKFEVIKKRTNAKVGIFPESLPLTPKPPKMNKPGQKRKRWVTL
jgi:hypothetical protein